MKNETGDTGTAHGNHRVSIHITAPLEFTYSLCSHFKYFPEYLRHVLEVSTDYFLPNRQYWKVKVFGIEHESTIEITAIVPNQLIAWHSVEGIENSGSLIFEGDTEQTELTIQIGYNPPLNVLGDLAEAIWYKQRFDEALEEDLTNFKSLAETKYQQSKNGQPFETVPVMDTAQPDGYEMSYIPKHDVITTAELENRLEWGEVAFTLLDVRPANVYAQAHLRGATSAPLEMLEARIRELTGSMSAPTERAIIVYSEQNDGLSTKAVAVLEHLGFDRVLDYTDGFNIAQAAKLPIDYQNQRYLKV